MSTFTEENVITFLLCKRILCCKHTVFIAYDICYKLIFQQISVFWISVFLNVQILFHTAVYMQCSLFCGNLVFRKKKTAKLCRNTRQNECVYSNPQILAFYMNQRPRLQDVWRIQTPRFKSNVTRMRSFGFQL